MTASATYIIKSASFTKDGGSATVIDGLEEVTIRQNGQVVAHGTDGLVAIQSHFIDNVEAEISVRSRNGSLFTATALQIGTHGSMAIVMQKRAAGNGATAGQDKTITAANCTITASDVGIPHADRGTFNLTAMAHDPNGSAANVLAFS
jgi:hypothetical protein